MERIAGREISGNTLHNHSNCIRKNGFLKEFWAKNHRIRAWRGADTPLFVLNGLVLPAMSQSTENWLVLLNEFLR
jgi:hypothetical protein